MLCPELQFMREAGANPVAAGCPLAGGRLEAAASDPAASGGSAEGVRGDLLGLWVGELERDPRKQGPPPSAALTKVGTEGRKDKQE